MSDSEEEIIITPITPGQSSILRMMPSCVPVQETTTTRVESNMNFSELPKEASAPRDGNSVETVRRIMKNKREMGQLKDAFPTVGAKAILTELSDEVRQLVNLNPRAFLVETPKPGEEYVTLRQELSSGAISHSGAAIRSVVESDLGWMNDAATVVNTFAEGYHSCSPLYFVPPRSVLIAAVNGNLSGERFDAVGAILSKHVADKGWVALEEFSPGGVCVIRGADGEYARAVMVGQSGKEAGMIGCVCLDFHALIDAAPEDIALLPSYLHPSRLPCSTFFARIRGIDYIPLEYQASTSGLFGQVSPGTFDCVTCPTAVFGRNPEMCVVDWTEGDSAVWQSYVLVDHHNAVSVASDPEPPSVLEAIDFIRTHVEGGMCDYQDALLWCGLPIPSDGAVSAAAASESPCSGAVVEEKEHAIPQTTQENERALSTTQFTDVESVVTYDHSEVECEVNDRPTTHAQVESHGQDVSTFDSNADKFLESVMASLSSMPVPLRESALHSSLGLALLIQGSSRDEHSCSFKRVVDSLKEEIFNA